VGGGVECAVSANRDGIGGEAQEGGTIEDLESQKGEHPTRVRKEMLREQGVF